MVIRTEQMDIFRRAAAAEFERQMVIHLYDFALVPCQAAGWSAVETSVRRGIEGARRYGLTSRGGARLYLELQVLFGSDFDTDQQYPWAKASLAGEPDDAAAQAESLYAAAMSYADAVHGPNHQYAREAAELLAVRLESPSGSVGQSGEYDLLCELRSLYPQRYQYAGEAGLRELIAEAKQAAREYSLPQPEGWVLFTKLMFAFGHGAARDPLCRWISTALEPGAGGPSDAVRRVARATAAHLRGMLDGARTGS